MQTACLAPSANCRHALAPLETSMSSPPSLLAIPAGLAASEVCLDCAEAPRERLLRAGASALTDAELVAVCLRTGGGGYGVLALARNLLDAFGGLAGLAGVPAGRLLQLPGLGPAKVATLLAVQQLRERIPAAELARGALIRDSRAALDFLRAQIGSAEREIFGCLFLDARHRLLGFEALFFGSIDRAHVHPRVVLKRALTYNAAALILAHNHPSGVSEPSASDIRLTHQLQDLLEQIEVRLVDHLVVTAAGGASMAELGLLAGNS